MISAWRAPAAGQLFALFITSDVLLALWEFQSVNATSTYWPACCFHPVPLSRWSREREEMRAEVCGRLPAASNSPMRWVTSVLFYFLSFYIPAFVLECTARVLRFNVRSGGRKFPIRTPRTGRKGRAHFLCTGVKFHSIHCVAHWQFLLVIIIFFSFFQAIWLVIVNTREGSALPDGQVSTSRCVFFSSFIFLTIPSRINHRVFCFPPFLFYSSRALTLITAFLFNIYENNVCIYFDSKRILFFIIQVRLSRTSNDDTPGVCPSTGLF